VPLRAHLDGHTVTTAFELGWSNLQNGELLAAAEGFFDLLITTDQQMRYQQNLSVVSEFEDLLCALCVPQRSLRLNLPFNAENAENAEDAEETLQLKTPLIFLDDNSPS